MLKIFVSMRMMTSAVKYFDPAVSRMLEAEKTHLHSETEEVTLHAIKMSTRSDTLFTQIHDNDTVKIFNQLELFASMSLFWAL